MRPAIQALDAEHGLGQREGNSKNLAKVGTCCEQTFNLSCNSRMANTCRYVSIFAREASSDTDSSYNLTTSSTCKFISLAKLSRACFGSERSFGECAMGILAESNALKMQA